MKFKINSYVIYIFGALGGLLFGYDTGVISGAILFIKSDLNLNSWAEGIVVSSILVGAMIGAAASGALSDQYGRRKTIMIAAVIFCIGALGSGMSRNMEELVIYRIVLGLAVGGASALVPVYLSELAPCENRGALSSLNQFMIILGILCAYIVNFAFAQSADGWRWMLGLAFIPSAILLIGMFFLPESPRWLVKNRREKEAAYVLSLLREGSDIQGELEEIKQTCAGENSGWKELTSKWVRPALTLGAGLALFQQFIGCNTVLYYAPTVFVNAGLGRYAAILGTIGIGVAILLATILAMWKIDQMGRKKLLLIGNVGMSISLFLIWIASEFFGQTTSSAYTTIVLFCSYIFFFGISWGPVTWVMLGEIFPLSVRGLGMGVCSVVNWGSNLLIALTFPVLLERFGHLLFVIFAFIGIVAFLFIKYKAIETKGKTLEQIEIGFHQVEAAKVTLDL